MAETKTRAKIGDTRTSANGYHYTKMGEGEWILTHHLIAEKKYGRARRADERVVFKDKDRTNLAPDNIEYVTKGQVSKGKEAARLRSRITELQAQLDEIESS